MSEEKRRDMRRSSQREMRWKVKNWVSNREEEENEDEEI